MARPTPIEAVPEETPPEYAPAYFLMLPGSSFKAISDAAAKRNMTLAQLVSVALSEYLKKSEVAPAGRPESLDKKTGD
jgi:hypothetical protein